MVREAFGPAPTALAGTSASDVRSASPKYDNKNLYATERLLVVFGAVSPPCSPGEAGGAGLRDVAIKTDSYRMIKGGDRFDNPQSSIFRTALEFAPIAFSLAKDVFSY